MFTAVMIVLAMFGGQAKVAAVALPDTPQGKHVQAWVTAFNSGDEKTFMKAQDELFTPAVLAKRTAKERAKMFQRLKGDFGTMTIDKVSKATAQQIQIQVTARDGAVGTFTFDFEDKAPYRISGLGIDVQAGDQ